MTYNEETTERLRGELRATPDVIEKKMFGGVSFLLGGNMAVGVVGDDLCVRVGPEAFDATGQLPGARTMDFTGRAPGEGPTTRNAGHASRGAWWATLDSNQ